MSLSLLLLLANPGTTEAREPIRHAPPEASLCERNQLTSYSGVLSAYRVGPPGLQVEIATGWGSVETVVLPLADPVQPEAAFLLHSKPFGISDWSAIESKPGNRTPRPEIGLIAWVCLDNETATLIDWRP